MGFIERDLVAFVGLGVLGNGRFLGLAQTTVSLMFTDACVHITIRGADVHHTTEHGTLYTPQEDSGSLASLTDGRHCWIFYVSK